MKLLVIDDNRMFIDSVKKLLDTTYIIDHACTGYQGIECARSIQYSLILLNLRLPDVDGLEVCRALRKANITAPIFMITVQKDPEVSIKLLDSGADDCITKPFNNEVLRARIAAALRRSQEMSKEKIITISDLAVNITRREVRRGDVTIFLRRKEFDILEYMVLNQGRILTREMIFNHVWEAGTERWNNTIDVHIKYLRDKIDRPFNKPLIKTAYGIGYVVDDKT